MTVIGDGGTLPSPPEPEYKAPPAPPCEIVLRDGNVFFVNGLDNWQWHERGMFATGKWTSDSEDEDLLIPTESIRYVKFDFDAITVDGEVIG